MSQTLNVHVRVNDAATSRPTPVRIRIVGPDEKYIAPLGRTADFPTGRGEAVGGQVYLNQKQYAYIDGSAEFPLPTGVPLAVEVTKGPAYRPIRETIQLGEGQLALRMAIERWPDEEWSRLMGVDTRAHFLSPADADLEGAAEGIEFVNLLAGVHDYRSDDGHQYRIVPNLSAFSGQADAFAKHAHVAVNTFNVHPVLGRLGLLNCHRPVYPLTFGHADETDDWSLSDWCGQCHRKNGLVVWCDAYRPEAGLPGGEAFANALLGNIDAIELDAAERSSAFVPMLYRLWDAGVILPLAGGSAKASNRVAIGSMRTLTPFAETYGDAIENIRRGWTAATNGPLLRVTASQTNNRLGPRKLDTITADAASIVPFERVELVSNGEVIASATPTVDEHGVYSATAELPYTFPAGTWVAARCWGTGINDLYANGPVFAHTSAMSSPGEGPNRTKALAALKAEVQAVSDWVESNGRFANPKRKQQLLDVCGAVQAKR